MTSNEIAQAGLDQIDCEREERRATAALKLAQDAGEMDLDNFNRLLNADTSDTEETIDQVNEILTLATQAEAELRECRAQRDALRADADRTLEQLRETKAMLDELETAQGKLIAERDLLSATVASAALTTELYTKTMDILKRGVEKLAAQLDNAVAARDAWQVAAAGALADKQAVEGERDALKDALLDLLGVIEEDNLGCLVVVDELVLDAARAVLNG